MSLKVEIGDRFGKLVIKAYAGKDKNGLHQYELLCDCGNETVLQTTYLTRGRVKSCGCLRLEKLKEKLITHGDSNSPTYISWTAMKNRCTNKNTPAYDRYGGDGVTVCGRWLESFQNFLQDMGERPEGMTLNRIGGSKLYSRETCEWATSVQQARDQKIRKENTTGVRGINLISSGYKVRITTDEKRITLGTFKDFFEACCVRKSAELKYWHGSANARANTVAARPEYYTAAEVGSGEFRNINLSSMIEAKVNGVCYSFGEES